MSDRARLVTLTVAVAVAVHAIVVLYFPHALMAFVLRGIEARAGVNHAYFAPRPDASFRAIVRPSPDLLYAVCVLDLEAAPAGIDVEATLPSSYGSLAIYGEDTDVLHVFRDRDFAEGHAKLHIVPRGTSAAAHGGPVVRLPTARALLLERVLITDDESHAHLDQLRRTLSCKPTPRLRPER